MAAIIAGTVLGAPNIAVAADQTSCLEKANPDRSGDPQAIIRTQMAGAACDRQPARRDGWTPMPPADTHPATGSANGSPAAR